ncbi:MAG: ABC transporter permease [Mycoplasma sp.]|nr:ABC transporter permease [Candidatus Hennigella equi]
MKNLVKNVIRSFKNNKISIIGLIFLLFFGLGVFCVMSNTTTNIKNEYTSLAQRGRLHDFTASELYEVGTASYAPYTKGFSYYDTNDADPVYTVYNSLRDPSLSELLTTNDLYHVKGLPEIREGETSVKAYYAIPEQQKLSDNKFSRTYHLKLDSKTSTGLYASFAEQKSDSRLVDFYIKIVAQYDVVPTYVTDLQSILDSWNAGTEPTDEQMESLAENNIFADDYQDCLSFLSSQTQNIYSVMTTTDTPLALHLDKKYADEVEHRFFKSINVTATKDNIFYKIIDSNPEDTIDKMVLFSDSYGRRGNQLFSVDDWAPYNSEVTIYDTDGNVLEPGSTLEPAVGPIITIPTDFNDVATFPLYSLDEIKSWDGDDAKEAQFAYSQILQIRFKRMYAADRSTDALDNTLKALAAVDLNPTQYYHSLMTPLLPPSTIPEYYEYYLSNWYLGAAESVTISANGNVVYSWVEATGTPQTCTISNWTSKFAIVNPQHMEKNGKRVIDPSMLNGFKPFREWYFAVYDRYPSGEIDQSEAVEWFNSLNQNQFSFWVDPSTKSTWTEMSYDIPYADPIVIERGTKPGQWNGIGKQFISNCGGYNEIIWGCGLTPDFMYPVVDISRPTPNTKTECLVYTNDSGYNSIKLAFVNSTVEDYLVARFKPSVNSIRRQAIINEINTWAQQAMIFPDNVKSAYFANDTSNLLNCSGFRVAYLPGLVKVVEIVSVILCSFIGILCLVICFVIIKRYVENNRVNIGIMRANGIKKWKIGLSLLPFALVPALIGGIAAYLTGLGLQAAALSLFSNYWMLPTPLIKFNWISFLSCIFVPFIIFSIICFVTTLLVLRVNSVELMKAGSEFKTNSFSRIAKKPFKHFSVLTRFRVALAFNSISRLIMLAAMTCLTMSSLVFAFTTFDKLNSSRVTNSSQFDYSFNLELTTPTSSGSVYSVYDYSKKQEDRTNTGFGWSDPTQYMFNVLWNTNVEGSPDWHTTQGVDFYRELTKPYSRNFITGPLMALYGEPSYADAIGHYGNLMIPNLSDSTGQNQDLLYLQNKLCTRLTLDYNIGLPGVASSNPWEIALALMPANSRNIAADSYNKIINKAGHEYPQYSAFFNYDKESDTYTLKTDMSVVGYLLMAFNSDFINLLKTIYSNQEMIEMEYPIAYGNLPLNWNLKDGDKKDETYTYISGNIVNLSNNHSFDASHEIKIEGIVQDSQYIKLTDKKGNNLNNWLFDQNYINKYNVDENLHPLIVNSYAAHKYNLKVGDKMCINVSNTVDRFEQQLHKEKTYDNNYQFVVVGVSQGTNDEAFYTTQQRANNILGLPNGVSWNKTHKYMMWSVPEVDVFGNYTFSDWSEKRPHLADLSGIGSDNPNNISIYTFTNGSTIVDPIIDESLSTAKLSRFDIKVPIGFNGVYTQNKEGKPITNGLSLYSYTGMYPGTSVYQSSGSVNKFAELLAFGNNLSIANLMTGIDDHKYYEANADRISGRISPTKYASIIEDFIAAITSVYGDTTMITAMRGAMDVAASDLIYSNLISTFDLAETSIMAIIIPITIIIVAIISNLIISDSKRMAAMLKALGYSDAKNLMSILALFIPTIFIGLMLAIPLSFGLTLGYQTIIFNTANILVDVTQKWWYYVAAMGGIGIILIGTYAIGFVSLKRNRLVDQIK